MTISDSLKRSFETYFLSTMKFNQQLFAVDKNYAQTLKIFFTSFAMKKHIHIISNGYIFYVEIKLKIIRQCHGMHQWVFITILCLLHNSVKLSITNWFQTEWSFQNQPLWLSTRKWILDLNLNRYRNKV